MKQGQETKYAAFFRNLNLGRLNCPNRTQFESAFLAAGATAAQSFLTNGTMVFAASGPAKAARVLKAASSSLAGECGLKEPAYIRSVECLADFVANDPFIAVERDSVYDCYISFLHPKVAMPEDGPRESTRRDVIAVQISDGEVFTITHKLGNTPGSPNAWLEKMLGLPVTTRAWNTIVRLVNKHA